jgi:hypothetical protein
VQLGLQARFAHGKGAHFETFPLSMAKIKDLLLSSRTKRETTRSSMTEKFIALYQPHEAHRFAGLLLGRMADRPGPRFDAQRKYSPRSRSGNRRPIGKCPPYRNTAVSYRRAKAAHKA